MLHPCVCFSGIGREARQTGGPAPAASDAFSPPFRSDLLIGGSLPSQDDPLAGRNG